MVVTNDRVKILRKNDPFHNCEAWVVGNFSEKIVVVRLPNGQDWPYKRDELEKV